jgi:hypothetical protein
MANRDVVLLGSIALGSADEVFRTIGAVLGERVRRIPDGETGGARSYWIQAQTPFFLGNPQLEMVEPDPARPGGLRPARIPSAGLYSPTMAGAYRGQAKLREGVDPADLRFDNFGYADWAEESYGVFGRLKQEGLVPAATRFQVSIPSTQVMLQSRIYRPDVPKIAPAYEAAIFREVERIAASIPHEELAIQWDCTEPVRYEEAPAEERRELVARMAGLSACVPEGVELGYHLCYGDWEHRHMREPDDAATLVEMANGITAGVRRPIDWLHVPVPRSRDDDAYYAPLRDLKLQPETELVMGLIHHTDGIEGTRRRMQAANRVVSGYGISTECGMGRRPAETIHELLQIHREAADLAL